MFEKMRIKQHMEVTNSSGQHVGTVDEVDGDTIKLTRTDSSDGQHHYLDMDAVDRIEDNRIYLNAGAALQTRAAEQQHQTGAQQAQFGSAQSSGAASGGRIDPNTYAPNSATSTPGDAPLFGEAGNGSVMTGADKA